jgi:multidrug resistance protein MdtO
MATAARTIAKPTSQTITKPASPLQWFGEFLKQELAPYPGREAAVARAVVAATIVMILTMVFRIPYGAYAALYTITISRENPQATINDVRTIVLAFAACVLYVLVGAMFFIADPNLRLFWIIGTLFLMFYALRVVTNHGASVRFGYLIVVTIPLWDEHISAEGRVEGTLWAFGAISLASIITALAEVMFAEVRGSDDLLQPIAQRLAAVEQLLDCYINGRPVDNKADKEIGRLVMVGTSRLRRFLNRSSYTPRYAEQMGAVVGLTGRLVDIASNLARLSFDLSESERQQVRKVAADLESVRKDLLNGRVPKPVATNGASMRRPLLHELAVTVSMIPAVFTGSRSLVAYAPLPQTGDPPSRFFVSDALSNPEHLKFALKGCLAAGLCYLFYSAKDWPGLNTAITTCFLTALTTVGSSRQKQVLRMAGVIIGVVLGIGAQIFILPYLDSIAGFTLLFLAVTIPATWIATSGPRLSYCGVQILVAFYLINISEFRVQTSLEPGRDRVLGIFLGLLMMWTVFDQLWGIPAVIEMKRGFVGNLRLLAQFARAPSSADLRVASEQSYVLREKITTSFDAVRASADAVLLEFGPTRQQAMALRSRIKELQPQLRTLFLTRIALWKYRAQLSGFELPETILRSQLAFDAQSAKMLDGMADRMEGRATQDPVSLEEPFNRLEQAVRNFDVEQPQELLEPRFQTFLLLSRRYRDLATSLNQQIHPVEGL